MSWHYSQALVAAYSVENSLDGEPSAPSSGTPTHGTFWSPDKMTDALKPSRSGMTFRPSTVSHGEAVLMWCLAASPARTSLPLAKVPGSKESEAACGSTWRESSVKYCRDSSSWKTHRCLWEEVLPSSSLTLPKWGMMRNGALWERITPAHLTSETESGLWPTPRAGNPGSRPNGKGGKILAEEVKKSLIWPTPNQRDWKDTGATQGNRKSPNLGTMVHQRGCPAPAVMTGGATSTECTLENAPALKSTNGTAIHTQFATPQARDYRTGSTDRWENPERSRNLNDQIGGQLNPTWVEWLMGWPLGWTDCAASATAKFREWLNSHGTY